MTDDGRTPALTRRGALALGGAAIGGVAIGGASAAAQNDDGNGDDNANDDDDGNGDEARHYRVTVANLTPGQPFTPPAVAAHRSDVEVFAVGEPANEPTQELAENGNLEPLLEFVGGSNAVRDAAVGQSPLVPEDDPGETGQPYVTMLTLSADASAEFLTFASMLIATNDGFVGLDTVPLPDRVNESRTYYANGYDAGTERNTEDFDDLVPPAQSLIMGGEADGGTTESDPALAENGVIRPHPGIQGVGDLDPEVYGWREPAALVQVERLSELQTEFEATLSGDEEVPPVETDASGASSLEFDGDELAYEVTVEDIDDVTAAHIHCGPRGANGPVGVTLFEGDPVSPDGVLAEGTVSAPDDGNDCGWTDLDDVVAGLRSGNTYVNVHTEANPAGEVRGQVR
ncbi:MAG TPA: spondin domain-containing protein [Halobacteriales archaeon]|nr:spondin domain-containing protein [Halobacteriales archaeon]